MQEDMKQNARFNSDSIWLKLSQAKASYWPEANSDLEI